MSNVDRNQIFNKKLQEPLEEYLKFRHFIGHTYGFQLEWIRMEYLITHIKTIWQTIKESIDSFLENN